MLTSGIWPWSVTKITVAESGPDVGQWTRQALLYPWGHRIDRYHARGMDVVRFPASSISKNSNMRCVIVILVINCTWWFTLFLVWRTKRKCCMHGPCDGSDARLGQRQTPADCRGEYPVKWTVSLQVLWRVLNSYEHLWDCCYVCTTIVVWKETLVHSRFLCHPQLPQRSIISFICPLTVRVIGAPRMISQPVSSIFLYSPMPSGTWRTPGLSIPWCCLPTSSSVCLVFFPLSLCLARWFWPDLMNGRHDHTSAVCISLQWSGGRHVVWLPAGSWHGLPRW